MKTTVKCCYKCCPYENEIIINSQSVRDVVRYDNKYYHSDCFIKMVNQKKSRYKKEDIIERYNNQLNNIDNYKKDAYAFLIDRVSKNELNEFLMNSYGVDSVSSFVWMKINSIISGEYKNVGEKGIPSYHLLDMWKRKYHELIKMHQKLIVKGKNFTPAQLISYDLEVIISKYDSYLKWLHSQEVIESDMKMVSESNDEFLTRNIKTTENNIVEDKIHDIVDDIFDD